MASTSALGPIQPHVNPEPLGVPRPSTISLSIEPEKDASLAQPREHLGTVEDPIVVDWPDADPENPPQNWSQFVKTTQTIQVRVRCELSDILLTAIHSLDCTRHILRVSRQFNVRWYE